MQSEIDNVKTKTKEIVAKLAGGKPAPVVRVGLVAFRDRGDEYVTKVFQFTGDIDKVVKDISGLKADGGGDTPESVNEALHVSVNDLQWDKDAKTLKLLFLIGDAGPHAYANDYDWHKEAKVAISRGIQINTVGCQGLEPNGGAEVFQQIAKLADGKYEPLSYRQEIATKGGSKTIISSGGKMFEVKAKDRDAWRAGAAELAKAGEAKEVAVASPALAARSRAFSAALAAPMAAPMVMDMTSASAGGGGGAAYAGSTVSRGDSNLADMVLLQTKSAASKRLGIDFNTK
jgi:hypothetical protein